MLLLRPSDSALGVLLTVRADLLGHFELNPLRRGGDAVRVENLSAQSDYQRKKVAHNQHKREQTDRERMQTRFRSKAETHLRVITIAGDGRCLFRALVSTPRPGLPSTAVYHPAQISHNGLLMYAGKRVGARKGAVCGGQD